LHPSPAGRGDGGEGGQRTPGNPMPLPVRSLPVLQNWDCQGCSACCRHYHVSVSTEERQRIESQGWDKEPDLQGVPMFVRVGGWFSKSYRLNHRPDGACVFLGPDNRCRIHNRHGSAAKPLACRIYPYALVPAGDHWKLGLRFACPSAAEDLGKPLSEHLADAREYAAMLEAEWGTAAITRPPPNLQGSQTVTWSDLFRIIAAISKVLANEKETVERRWRKVLFLVSTLRKARFDGKGDPEKAVTGGRLSELLHVLAMAAEDEVPDQADELPPPGWVGRMVFRPLVALYARKDTGPDRGSAQGSLAGRLFSAIQFTRGKGNVPRVHAAITTATFADTNKPFGNLSDKASSLLTRWARVKVESGQFCGPTNFGLGVWDGLESLASTFPAAMWLARVLAAGGRPVDEAIVLAVRIVDDNFGFNKLLGSMRQKFALRLLAARGELPKLIAWYGK
jgi:lysine-N-methylase